MAENEADRGKSESHHGGRTDSESEIDPLQTLDSIFKTEIKQFLIQNLGEFLIQADICQAHGDMLFTQLQFTEIFTVVTF